MFPPSKLFLCLVWPFWSSITFYVSCALQVRLYSSQFHMLAHYLPGDIFGMSEPFTCSHGWCRWWRPGWTMRRCYIWRTRGRDTVLISSGGCHGNNFEMMMVMIRVLKPGLLVDKEHISFKYWSWLPKVKGIIWTILLFVTSSSASMNQTQEGESSSRWFLLLCYC